MADTLLGDIKSDRVAVNLLLSPSDLDAGHTDATHHHRVVRIGSPEVQDNRMCAQCVGECKVF
jgi:hypothetical protein